MSRRVKGKCFGKLFNFQLGSQHTMRADGLRGLRLPRDESLPLHLVRLPVPGLCPRQIDSILERNAPDNHIVEKDISLLGASLHHMLEKSRKIQPGESWNGIDARASA